jgi:hypothetical protein
MISTSSPFNLSTDLLLVANKLIQKKWRYGQSGLACGLSFEKRQLKGSAVGGYNVK